MTLGGPRLTGAEGGHSDERGGYLDARADGEFLDHVAVHRLAGCYALTVLRLRREEVGGLRWSDIDLQTGALHI
jgi:integrase